MRLGIKLPKRESKGGKASPKSENRSGKQEIERRKQPTATAKGQKSGEMAGDNSERVVKWRATTATER